jgi:hypothetical protein
MRLNVGCLAALISVAICNGQEERFERFQVPVYHGVVHEPLVPRPQQLYPHAAEDLILHGRDKANFAGHYRIEQISCGTACITILIVNVITGRVFLRQPFGSLSVGPFETNGRAYRGLKFEPDSRLLVADGCFDLGDVPTTFFGTRDYVWQDGELTLLPHQR